MTISVCAPPRSGPASISASTNRVVWTRIIGSELIAKGFSVGDRLKIFTAESIGYYTVGMGVYYQPMASPDVTIKVETDNPLQTIGSFYIPAMPPPFAPWGGWEDLADIHRRMEIDPGTSITYTFDNPPKDDWDFVVCLFLYPRNVAGDFYKGETKYCV